MNLADVISEAMKKMPESKEVWLHPKHKSEDLSGLNLKIKYNALIPSDRFLLSKEELDKMIEKELKKFL